MIEGTDPQANLEASLKAMKETIRALKDTPNMDALNNVEPVAITHAFADLHLLAVLLGSSSHEKVKEYGSQFIALTEEAMELAKAVPKQPQYLAEMGRIQKIKDLDMRHKLATILVTGKIEDVTERLKAINANLVEEKKKRRPDR